ncbi:MAG: DNA/RNA non-specific endonuclease [Gaiellaceae bacterium]
MSQTVTNEEKSARVKQYLRWIAPPERLASLAADPGALEGLETTGAAGSEIELAADAVRRVERDEEIPPQHADALEAIILPNERPVVDIVDGTYARPAQPFGHLGDDTPKKLIGTLIPSIGRIELPEHPSLPYGGTGFVVGDGLLMTNRHVADLFALGLGREELSFRPGQGAGIDFLRERDRTGSLLFEIVGILLVHPFWDMALLKVEGLGAVPPLRLSVAAPGELEEREVVVIGYPALDTRNNVDLQNRIFGGVFNVKRLQPGKLRNLADIRSFGHVVRAVTHDSSTLGGNSGSAVIDVEDGLVLALHFAGHYLEANYAVPAHELALDRRVVEAGVNFDGEVVGTGVLPWDSYWLDADSTARHTEVATVAGGPGQPSVSGAASVTSEASGLSWSIPLEVTVQIRPQAPTPVAAAAADAAVEALVEPFRDLDYSGRPGYDDRFLGLLVPLPTVTDESVVSRLDDGTHVVPYEHFSAVVNKDRRLALFTASNVDADPSRKEPELGKDYSRNGLAGLTNKDDEKWFTDPRIPALHQLPDRFFTKDRKSFDRGHIVRREDVAWGDTYDEVRRANGDTYHVTNCSPQIASFNRSNLQGVWGKLENLILKQAESERYALFAGPVFRPDDRFFRGVDDEGPVHVRIPRQFWKIVVARKGDELQTFAFVLDQDLSATDLESVVMDLEFVVDELWRSRMISLPDLEQLVAPIRFPAELHDSDQIDAGGGEAVRAEAGIESVGG